MESAPEIFSRRLISGRCQGRITPAFTGGRPMSLSLLLKLFILPFYLLLPFTLDGSGTAQLWYLPFLIWTGLIMINALAEYIRSRR